MTKEIQDNVKSYIKGLKNNDPNLTEINLSSSNITDALAKEIAEALEVNESLKEIDLSYNHITDTRVKYIADALKVNQSLKVINFLNNNITDAGAKDIAEALKVNQTLTQINLVYNNITDLGAEYLIEALKANYTLTNIDLDSDRIPSWRLEQITTLLDHNKHNKYVERLRRNDPGLTQIDLRNNDITDTGAKDLTEALKVNRTLTQINLSDNYITDTGAKDLAEALKVNRTLTQIDLGHNYITDTGAKDLAEALKVNRALTEIDLSHNNITAAGAKDILEALTFNKTLTKIDLSGNNITPELLQQITTLLDRNKEAAKSKQSQTSQSLETKKAPTKSEPISNVSSVQQLIKDSEKKAKDDENSDLAAAINASLKTNQSAPKEPVSSTSKPLDSLQGKGKLGSKGAELPENQLQQAKDQQVDQTKEIAAQEKKREIEKSEVAEMKKQMEKLTKQVETQQQSHPIKDNAESNQAELEEAIKTSFCDKIAELNLEDKLGSTENWQIIKNTGKDSFRLVMNVTDPKKRLGIKTELAARNIATKIDIVKKTISIENIDENNLDELLVKLETPNPAPSPSPSAASASKTNEDSQVVTFKLS